MLLGTILKTLSADIRTNLETTFSSADSFPLNFLLYTFIIRFTSNINYSLLNGINILTTICLAKHMEDYLLVSCIYYFTEFTHI